MKPIWLALAVLGQIFFLSPIGFAESFDAIVTAVMEGGSGIQATVTNGSGQTKQNVMFHLLPTVDLSAYKTMDKIKPGNRIKIQAETDSSGSWQISRIEPYQSN
jgi:hypothetical protein